MLVLVMRYSRLIPGPKYNTATAVVMAELIKFFSSLAIYAYQTPGLTPTQVLLDLFGKNSNWLMMTVPAILYFIQNNLRIKLN